MSEDNKPQELLDVFAKEIGKTIRDDPNYPKRADYNVKLQLTVLWNVCRSIYDESYRGEARERPKKQ